MYRDVWGGIKDKSKGRTQQTGVFFKTPCGSALPRREEKEVSGADERGATSRALSRSLSTPKPRSVLEVSARRLSLCPPVVECARS